MKCETEFMPSLSNNLAETEKLGGRFSLFLFLVPLLKQLLFLLQGAFAKLAWKLDEWV